MRVRLPTGIPCYVSGAGLFASDATRNFKTPVITWLEESGLGYDTRYRYYRGQFAESKPPESGQTRVLGGLAHG